MMTPEAFARDYIFRWEDGSSKDPKKTHSMDPVDNGNWTGNARNVGALVGSNHGVTPLALAAHRDVPVKEITYDVMHKLTIEEAADIALKAYYVDNKLNLLPWNPTTASIMDFGWGAGAFRAVEKLQAMVGVSADRLIGKGTIAAYKTWLAGKTPEQAAEAWALVRNAYYEAVIKANPAKAKYRNGWKGRTDYFTPGHKEGWWTRFMKG